LHQGLARCCAPGLFFWTSFWPANQIDNQFQNQNITNVVQRQAQEGIFLVGLLGNKGYLFNCGVFL
jgi:hypothetical protein